MPDELSELKSQSPASDSAESVSQRFWRTVKFIITGQREGSIWKPEVIELYERIRRRISGPEDGSGQINSHAPEGRHEPPREENLKAGTAQALNSVPVEDERPLKSRQSQQDRQGLDRQIADLKIGRAHV